MRLVDAEEVKAKMESTFDMQDLYLPCHFQNILDETPTVDAVEVVRCKDCKKYIPCQKLPIGTSKWCGLFDRATCEMNYCGWGERKEDEIEMLPTQMSGRGER